MYLITIALLLLLTLDAFEQKRLRYIGMNGTDLESEFNKIRTASKAPPLRYQPAMDKMVLKYYRDNNYKPQDEFLQFNTLSTVPFSDPIRATPQEYAERFAMKSEFLSPSYNCYGFLETRLYGLLWLARLAEPLDTNKIVCLINNERKIKKTPALGINSKASTMAKDYLPIAFDGYDETKFVKNAKATDFTPIAGLYYQTASTEEDLMKMLKKDRSSTFTNTKITTVGIASNIDGVFIAFGSGKSDTTPTNKC